MQTPKAIVAIGVVAYSLAASCVAQVWRDTVPPTSVGSVCADTTRRRILLVGAAGGGLFTPILSPASWWFDGASYSRAAPANQGPPGYGLLAHDSLRGQNVYFHFNSPTTETWEHDGQTWTQVFPNTLPNAALVQMVFATNLGAVVGVANNGSTWHYDGHDWSLSSSTVSPPPRGAFGLGFDPVRQVVVLQGGVTPAGVSLQDTWEYDGATWTQRLPATVPPAGPTRTAFDTVLGELVARIDPDNVNGWDWRYDGNDWAQIPTVLASYPATRTLITSPTTGRVWWFDQVQTQVIEELQGVSWIPVAGSVRPSPQFGGGAAVDPRTDTLMLFGGSNSQINLASDEQWLRTGNTWYRHQLYPRPPARLYSCLVHDTARDRFVLFGGYSGSSNLSDTWSFANGQWQWLGNAGPSARERAAYAYDPVRRRVVLFGGNGASLLGDLWFLDDNGWSQQTTASGPLPRRGAAMTYDAAHDRLVMFGGETATGDSDETWYLRDTTWTLLQGGIAPSPRTEVAMAYDAFGGDVVLLGGRDATTTLADCWSLRDGAWTQMPAPASALQRFAGNLISVPARAHLELHRGARLQSFFGQLYGIPYRDEVLREADAQPRVARHGVGCATSAGALDLAPAAGSLPQLGTSFVLELSNLPAASAAWIALGTRIDSWQGEALPIDLQAVAFAGCHLWIAPSILSATTTIGSTAQTTVSLPALPALSGLVLAAQGIVFDNFAPNGLGAVSNAIVATLR